MHNAQCNRAPRWREGAGWVLIRYGEGDMVGILSGALLAVAVVGAPGWEKQFTLEETGADLRTVWAAENGVWIAAGRNVVVRHDVAGVTTERLVGRTILGIGGRPRYGLYALGTDQLVLRLDGKKWVEEHFVPAANGGKDTSLRDVYEFDEPKSFVAPPAMLEQTIAEAEEISILMCAGWWRPGES